MPEQALARHDLIWLSAAAASSAVVDGPCSTARARAGRLLGDWIAAGRPLIVARQGGDCPDGQIRLGLALPPALGKHRLAFRAARAHIVRRAPPPPFDARCLAALPAAWQPRLSALMAMPALAATAPRLLGSAGMQVATGVPCLGADSDLDLLLSPADWPAALAACAALAKLDASGAGPRVDGEVRNAAGDAVAWRELHTNAGQLLVKALTSVGLVTRDAFADGFVVRAGCTA